MEKTPAYLIRDIITPEDRQCLLDYLAQDDYRTDNRPDVRSKHPRWDDLDWPRDIIHKAMVKAVGPGFMIEEITFRKDRIGLRLHTDNASPANAVGKTIMLLLHADPMAHTVFFKNYCQKNDKFGTFFTRSPWNPYCYKISNRVGDLVEIPDLRVFYQQCIKDPGSIKEFDVNDGFVESIRVLIAKRSLPKLELDQQTAATGYMQPAQRVNSYDILTDYLPEKSFDAEFHARYLRDIPAEDLRGLTVDSILEWQIDGAIVFDREQLHCSSSAHKQKTFVTVFYHHPD